MYLNYDELNKNQDRQAYEQMTHVGVIFLLLIIYALITGSDMYVTYRSIIVVIIQC